VNPESGTTGGGPSGAAGRRWLPSFDAPTVLVALAWLAIWFLWPLNGVDRPRARAQATGRVGYLAGGPAAPWYVEPDWFARTTRPGFGMPDVTAAMDSAVPDRSVTERPRFVQGGVGVEQPAGGTMPAGDTNGEVKVRWQIGATFGAVAPPPIVVSISPELKARGFELPPYTNSVRSVPDRQWQVVAHVDVGADGRAENVLIEFGCEDPQVNATIARWLHRGVAGGQGAPVSGRVTVGGPGNRR
jgi:hypothetical protein